MHTRLGAVTLSALLVSVPLAASSPAHAMSVAVTTSVAPDDDYPDCSEGALFVPTIIGGASGVVEGTEGDDVIVSEGARVLAGGGDDIVCQRGSSAVADDLGSGDDRYMSAGDFSQGLTVSATGGPGDDSFTNFGRTDVVAKVLVDMRGMAEPGPREPGVTKIRVGDFETEFLLGNSVRGTAGGQSRATTIAACAVSWQGGPRGETISVYNSGGPGGYEYGFFDPPPSCADPDAAVDGGGGDDTITSGKGADRLVGGTGDDHLDGRKGKDRLSGGTGDDLLQGWFDADLLVGGTGADRLIGSRGDDRIFGNDGRDVLKGEQASDLLNGGAGRDVTQGGLGRDRCVKAEVRSSC